MGSEEFQKRLSQELDKMKTIQKNMQKAMSAKQTLDGQLSENNVVKEELEFLTPENKVYKMTGPVLVEQDIEEAKQNVEKRIMFITSEIRRNEDLLKDLSSQQDKQQEILQRLQKEFAEEQQMKMAKK
ncbi:prefoldin subunit 6-like [Argiope bruennichi]|uniref:Probable prefoldin subunit 6 n=1 Tax=Argiope bruennichi TaxID=94029 RepID=A0A8T0FV98_ARGBR|nr:prefoldin subunit 6-like [Argiope bruennichi]KAF8794128.1 Prefoldin subunit 6 like protein [Argiope bruennichi]